MELLKLNLAIEPDLQNFIQFVLTAVGNLGGNVFVASLATLTLIKELRSAGAGTGYPLPATLELAERKLLAHWGNDGRHLAVALFPVPPDPTAVRQLYQHLQQSTARADPAVLLRRTAEMERFLNETRERTEQEIRAMQDALEQRQAELSATIQRAETDALTGLLNRRAYDEKLQQAYRRVLRQKNESLSLILFDLDYFKQINDEFGHQYGDAYLNKMAHAMREVVRTDVDLLFRFGGDEFAMLLFCDAQIACSKAMKILAQMNGKVSIGIACIAPDDSNPPELEDFIHTADKALYEAKNAGRGRVVVNGCPPSSGTGCAHFCQPRETK
ncbi:MAG: diguanylate cyclase [Sulfuricella denitrificans]|nr:diguanylate cyclase [Sulfuricella denitrificans]